MLPDLTGTKEIVELAKPLLGSPVKELGELLADRVRFWRWKSTVKIIKMANEIRQKEHIGRKEVPLKVFLPLIEEASKESEDQDEVCQLWARLLATSDKETTGFDLVCIDMLKFIGPLEAILLNYVYSSRNKRFRVDTELATIIDEKYGGCNDELDKLSEERYGRVDRALLNREASQPECASHTACLGATFDASKEIT